MTFQDRVFEIRKSKRCGAMEAMQIARVRYPTEFEAYQNSAATESAPKSEARAEVQKRAVESFQKAVDDLRRLEPHLTHTAAMRRIRASQPKIFKAAYE